MEIKHYRRISNFTGFIMGVFILSDVLNYPFLFAEAAETPRNNLICQGIYVSGLICLIAFYATILQTIKKKGVFIRRNELTFRYFGFAILLMGLLSDILFNFMTDDRPAAPRILAFLGGTLVFVSYLFKVGIKIQEEQELTI